MWPQNDVDESITRSGLVHSTDSFYREVGVFPLRVFSQHPKRGDKVTGNGTEQQVFWGPPALQTTELWRRRKMDGIRSRVRLCQSIAARRPLRHDSMLVGLFHALVPFCLQVGVGQKRAGL